MNRMDGQCEEGVKCKRVVSKAWKIVHDKNE